MMEESWRNKREAIRQIAALLAEKVYELVLENF
jgi:mannitol/fructose-specific phosphotransferase system IIA component (Ntr-type)